jgi:hypothetical protein
MMMIALALGGLSACATTGQSAAVQREAASLARYEAAAGEPVGSFRYFRLDTFVVLGDSELALWTNPRTAWLLTVDDSCPELRWSLAIGLDAGLNRVYRGTGAIRAGRDRCVIRSIRPIDVPALRESERAARA